MSFLNKKPPQLSKESTENFRNRAKENEEKHSKRVRKSIYCNECKIEEIVSVDKPNTCPFCESENVEINRW